MFPWASTAWTTGCVLQTVPAVPPPGWVTKAKRVAAPAEMVNAFDAALVRPLELAVKTLSVPERFKLNPENVARPEAALALAVPERVPVPVVNASVIDAVELTTRFPCESCTSTEGC